MLKGVILKKMASDKKYVYPKSQLLTLPTNLRYKACLFGMSVVFMIINYS